MVVAPKGGMLRGCNSASPTSRSTPQRSEQANMRHDVQKGRTVFGLHRGLMVGLGWVVGLPGFRRKRGLPRLVDGISCGFGWNVQPPHRSKRRVVDQSRGFAHMNITRRARLAALVVVCVAPCRKTDLLILRLMLVGATIQEKVRGE